LTSNSQSLIKGLKKSINIAIAASDFERANALKKQIIGVENIFRHQGSTSQTKIEKYSEIRKYLEKQFDNKRQINTIEMYDVSNISGKYAVASLVFFKEGIAEKKEYKKFKIKYTELLPNDIKMLKEVFSRRVNNLHWTMPDLILIDGGIAQLNAAIEIFSKSPAFEKTLLGSLAKGKWQLLAQNTKGVNY
jgi:excinuclease ABC subunit C